MLATFLQTVLGYLREIAELIVRGFVVAGVLSAILNKEAVARHLGGRNLLLSNLLGAPIGVVTPLCCCSAIPTAMTLYRAGSRRGPACAFLSAPPWFNWYGLAALVIFLGPRVAVAVAGSAVLIAFAAGLLIDLLGPRPSASVALAVATPAASCTCGAPCCGTSAAAGRLLDLSEPLGKRRAGVRFALEQVRELGL